MNEKKLLSKYLAKLGAKGGKAAAKRLSPVERRERARKGGVALAKKRRKGGAA
jgi:hypothetical protein